MAESIFTIYLKKLTKKTKKMEEIVKENKEQENQLESPTPLRDTPEEAKDESINHTFERMQKMVETIEKEFQKDN
jgi:hypothetical protein